jgi:integrase
MDYHVRGKRVREPGGPTEQVARRKLKKRMKEVHGDRFVGPVEERLTVVELADNLITHMKTRGAKSIPSFESHLRPVREAFTFVRAVDLTTARIERFIEERLEAGKAAATVNRETGALRQALNLARKQGRFTRVPYVPMLGEDNARQGFFERPEFEAVVAHLPEPIASIARFAYLTGWRKGEILSLTWAAVDRAAGEIRLKTSKNGHGRTLGYEAGDELAELIEGRWRARECTTLSGQTTISEYVFHRHDRPVADFKKVWAKACEAAKVRGRLFHDLRRTAVRDMVRAGVPETVAMSVTGHKTRSVFDRYNITSGDDQRAAIRRTAAHRAATPVDRFVVSIENRATRAAKA